MNKRVSTMAIVPVTKGRHCLGRLNAQWMVGSLVFIISVAQLYTSQQIIGQHDAATKVTPTAAAGKTIHSTLDAVADSTAGFTNASKAQALSSNHHCERVHITVRYNSSTDLRRLLFYTQFGDEASIGLCQELVEILEIVQRDDCDRVVDTPNNTTATTMETTRTFVTRSNVPVTLSVVRPTDTARSNSATTRQPSISAKPRLVVNFVMDCRHEGIATGNMLEFLLVVRLQASLAHQAMLNLSCSNAVDVKDTMVIPWILGTTTGSDTDSPDISDSYINDDESNHLPFWASRRVSVQEACYGRHGHRAPLGPLYKDVQFRLRTMALSLLGGPPLHDPTHPSHAFAQRYLTESHQGKGQQKRTSKLAKDDKDVVDAAVNLAANGYFSDGVFSYLPNDKTHPPNASLASSSSSLRETAAPLAWLNEKGALDDVAIHVRCGDLMQYFSDEYEFVKYRGLAKFISSEAQSIGIITTPFNVTPATTAEVSSNVRAADMTDLVQHRCRLVVTAFVDYLQERHPKARIAVRNDRNETTLSSYVRLIMARQSIAGTTSTFGVFPVLASFGTSYLISPPYESSVLRTRWILDEFGVNASRTTTTGSVPDIVVSQTANESAKISLIQKMFLEVEDEGVISWFKS